MRFRVILRLRPSPPMSPSDFPPKVGVARREPQNAVDEAANGILAERIAITDSAQQRIALDRSNRQVKAAVNPADEQHAGKKTHVPPAFPPSNRAEVPRGGRQNPAGEH